MRDLFDYRLRAKISEFITYHRQILYNSVETHIFFLDLFAAETVIIYVDNHRFLSRSVKK